MTRNDVLRLDTELGAIEITVHADRAPLTAAYVRQLVEDGRYTDAVFYRSTTLHHADRQPLIQGGPLAPLVVGSGAPPPNIALLKTLETIESTDITGLTHRAGTVSVARDLLSTGHALPELFICLDEYPDLDAGGRPEPDGQGFPAFGTVVEGLDVVASIAARETKGLSMIELLNGEVLTQPVRIISATYNSQQTSESSQ